ncbi:hypothetical protein L2E82_29564 [Cichorium intybus]|uniref:Uncharacterized protein n=1 Tax=Cichorium intybus TaxID=13427 RepID=A0ACB9CYK2_CICIN|nr:hypothetical protein L2E82_29564 [Cichorium intybus]
MVEGIVEDTVTSDGSDCEDDDANKGDEDIIAGMLGGVPDGDMEEEDVTLVDKNGDEDKIVGKLGAEVVCDVPVIAYVSSSQRLAPLTSMHPTIVCNKDRVPSTFMHADSVHEKKNSVSNVTVSGDHAHVKEKYSSDPTWSDVRNADHLHASQTVDYLSNKIQTKVPHEEAKKNKGNIPFAFQTLDPNISSIENITTPPFSRPREEPLTSGDFNTPFAFKTFDSNMSTLENDITPPISWPHEQPIPTSNIDC